MANRLPTETSPGGVETISYDHDQISNGTYRTTGGGIANGRQVIDTSSAEYQARVNAGRDNAGVTTVGQQQTQPDAGTPQENGGTPEETKKDPNGGGGGGSKKKTTTAATDPLSAEIAIRENPEPEIGSLEHIDTTPYEQMLEQQIAAAKEQNENSINYNVNKGVTDLQRAEEDAQADFEKQRKQVNADEAKALQNQALYAEARGDRGGIGAAQYAQIQATAATNRRAVNDAQTKLATDTARQISDLRAQGEFQKADAALTLTQSYLSKLMELWQYGTSTNLSIDQFNIELQKWKENYEIQMANITGVYKGGLTASVMASAASTLLAAGIMPSPEQLAALGLTEQQASDIIKKNKRRSGGGGSKPKTDGTAGDGSTGGGDAGFGDGIPDSVFNNILTDVRNSNTPEAANAIVERVVDTFAGQISSFQTQQLGSVMDSVTSGRK